MMVVPYTELSSQGQIYCEADGTVKEVGLTDSLPNVDAVAFCGTIIDKFKAHKRVTNLEKKTFKKYSVQIGKQLIAEAPIVVSIPGDILVNEQIGNTFARGKSGYIVLYDEVNQVFEADLVTTTMTVVADERWRKELKNKCPLQLIGLFGDPCQIGSRVLSFNYNEFRELMLLDPLT
jgi:hypothetical protein